MIVVRVELMSARTGLVSEIARMIVANTGESAGAKRNYRCATVRGRGKAMLDDCQRAGVVTRKGEVRDYPAESLHVWNLIARALAGMGYK